MEKDKSKYAEASRNRWKKVDPLERSHLMSLLVKRRWSKASKSKRRKHAMMMVRARKHI